MQTQQPELPVDSLYVVERADKFNCEGSTRKTAEGPGVANEVAAN